MLWLYNRGLSFSFAPYQGKDHKDIDRFDTSKTLKTTINYEGAALLYQAAMSICNGEHSEKELRVELPCFNNAALILEYKPEQYTSGLHQSNHHISNRNDSGQYQSNQHINQHISNQYPYQQQQVNPNTLNQYNLGQHAPMHSDRFIQSNNQATQSNHQAAPGNHQAIQNSHQVTQGNQMTAYLTITQNNEAISFKFSTHEVQVRENNQTVTKIIQSGLGVFALTVYGYLIGVGADIHLNKLPEDYYV
jgi:hypothetical protein